MRREPIVRLRGMRVSSSGLLLALLYFAAGALPPVVFDLNPAEEGGPLALILCGAVAIVAGWFLAVNALRLCSSAAVRATVASDGAVALSSPLTWLTAQQVRVASGAEVTLELRASTVVWWDLTTAGSIFTRPPVHRVSWVFTAGLQRLAVPSFALPTEGQVQEAIGRIEALGVTVRRLY